MKSVSCHCCWFWLDWFVVEGLAVFFLWRCLDYAFTSRAETRRKLFPRFLIWDSLPPSPIHPSLLARSACVYIYFLRGWFFFVTAKNGPEILSDFRYIVFRLLHAHYFVLSHFPSSLCCCSFSSFGTHKNFAKQTRNDLKGRKKAAAASKSKKKSIERVSEKLIWPAKNNRQQEEWERNQRSETSFNQKNIYIYLCVKPKTSPEANQLMMTKKEKNISFSFSSRFYFFSTSWHDFVFCSCTVKIHHNMRRVHFLSRSWWLFFSGSIFPLARLLCTEW